MTGRLQLVFGSGLEEARGVDAVLNAAALIYVAAFVAGLGQLVDFVLQATLSR